MTGVAELHEALLSVERAAREYVTDHGRRRAATYSLLCSALRELDEVRATVDRERKAARA